jgi:hypothetical protein
MLGKTSPRKSTFGYPVSRDEYECEYGQTPFRTTGLFPLTGCERGFGPAVRARLQGGTAMPKSYEEPGFVHVTQLSRHQNQPVTLR